MSCDNNAFNNYPVNRAIVHYTELDCNTFYYDNNLDTIFIRKPQQYNIINSTFVIEYPDPLTYTGPNEIGTDVNNDIDLQVGGTITDVFTDKTVVWQLQDNLSWLKVEEREVVELIS